MNLNIDIEHIIGAANRLNTKALTTPADLPSDYKLLSDDSIENVVNGAHMAILNIGWVLTDEPEKLTILQIFNRLQALPLTKQINLSLRPAMPSIIDIVLEDKSKEVASLASSDLSRSEIFLNQLSQFAIDNNWSDIHFEYRERYTSIRVRDDGKLKLYDVIAKTLSEEIRNLIVNSKSTAFAGQLNVMEPQSGALVVDLPKETVPMRISTYPDSRGQDMILRLLRDSKKNLLHLDDLGYRKPHLHIIQEALLEPQGLIIITGPTGSGKSTTLGAMITALPAGKKIVTAEDPVEIPLENATQAGVMETNNKRSYHDLCRAMLRSDPDVVMLGEIRDFESASTAIRAASTGHLTFSTLHTNQSMAVPDVLADLGVQRSRLIDSSLLLLLIAQRLSPKICSECAFSFEQYHNKYRADELITHRLSTQHAYFNQYNIDAEKLLYTNLEGCDACKQTGSNGRVAIVEIIKIEEADLMYIQNNDKPGWLDYLRSLGWENMHDHARHLCTRQIIDPLFAENSIGKFTSTSSGYDYKNVYAWGKDVH